MGYLTDVAQEHAILQGTYAAMYLSADSAKQLHDYYKAAIPNLPPPEEMHITTTYSRVPMNLPAHDFRIKLSSVFYEYEYFSAGEDKQILVLRVQSPLLDKLHKEAIDLGATWGHDEYKAHITLSPDTGIDNAIGANLPPLPKFEIVLDRYVIEDLKD